MPDSASPRPTSGESRVLTWVAILYSVCFASLTALVILERAEVLDAGWLKTVSKNSPLLFGFIAAACAVAIMPNRRLGLPPSDNRALTMLDGVGRVSAFVAALLFSVDQDPPINWLIIFLGLPIPVMFYISLRSQDASADNRIWRLVRTPNWLVGFVTLWIIMIFTQSLAAYGGPGIMTIALIIFMGVALFAARRR